MSSEEAIRQRYEANLQLLQAHGISLDQIRQRARCTQEELQAALHPDTFEQCSLMLVLRIRVCIEFELAARGWSGSSRELWREYDARASADWYRNGKNDAPPHPAG